MRVAVVILNWNGVGFLQKFLPTVVERTPRELGKVIVADNGSVDGSMEWVMKRYSSEEVGTILLDRNYGFTGGYNRALESIREDGYEFYLLLNSDIEVGEGWLGNLLSFMDSHPKCGACAPKILSYDRPEWFEHAGAAGGYVDRFYFPYCRGRVLDRIERDHGQYDEPVQVFWASGAAMLVRSALWHEFGGLEESFFAHMEEIDFCWRLQRGGWQIWAATGAAVYHVGCGTLPNNSPRKLYFNFRNNLLMMHRNLPRGCTRTRVMLVRKTMDWAIAAIYLLTGKFAFFKAVVQAHRDYRKMRGTLCAGETVCDVPRSREFLPLLALRTPEE